MLLKAAAEKGFLVFLSPHYYYPFDHKWMFGGSLEVLMHSIGMYDREGPLVLDGFEGSGADWLETFKPYIAGDNVIIANGCSGALELALTALLDRDTFVS